MTQNNRTLTLRALDIPTVHKFGIGFDNVLDDLFNISSHTPGNYPPHNVIKTGDDTVTIEVAVAGFDEGEVDVSTANNILTITGEQVKDMPANYEFLHRGISGRDFVQNFKLADHVEVLGATVKNGILTVYLERKVPEEKKPKSIAINYNK
jgi:molecular chaperone IbpA